MEAFRYVALAPLIGVLLLSAALGLIVAVPPLLNGRRDLAWRRVVRVGLASSLVLILAVTLGSAVITVGAEAGRANLVPLRSLRSQMSGTNPSLAFANMLGNILLFVPASACAVLAGIRPWAVLASAGCLSVLIECIQRAVGRSPDVDDVLLNLVGATLGVVAVLAVRLVFPRFLKPADPAPASSASVSGSNAPLPRAL